MIRHALAFTLALAPALAPSLAAAAPGTQLLRLIDLGLRDYRIETDVTKLTSAQAAALHLELSSPESTFFGSDFRTRQVILSILRWNDATNPDLQ